MFKKLDRLCVLLFLLLPVGHSNAQEFKDESPENKGIIGETLQKIARTVDPVAVVSIRYRAKSQESQQSTDKLVVTPFLLNVDQLPRGDGEREIMTLNVTVFTVSGTLSQDVRQLMVNVAQGFAEEVTLTVRSLPKEFEEAKNALLTPETPSKEGKKDDDNASSFFGRMDHLLQKAESIQWHDIIRNIILFAGGATVMLLVGLASRWLTYRKAVSTLDAGFKGLATALDTSSDLGARRQLDPAPSERQNKRSLEFVRPQEGDSDRNIGLLPLDSLFALLTDCYWCVEDEYGAYVWRRIPALAKVQLIERMSELSDYARYLNGKPEFNLGMDQDPSYLKPLPLHQVDMKTLTEHVRRNPGVLLQLSVLRVRTLQFKATERLKIYERAKSLQSIAPWPTGKSPARALDLQVQIDIRSLEDEKELLSLVDVSVEVMERIPSLGWILRLAPEKIAEILRPYSALDLASAWVGPPEILDPLAIHLGPKKFEMLKARLSRVEPSRLSPIFRAIHMDSVNAIRSMTATPNGKVDDAA